MLKTRKRQAAVKVGARQVLHKDLAEVPGFQRKIPRRKSLKMTGLYGHKENISG